MKLAIVETQLRQSNGWRQVARVEMDMSLAGDGTTAARARDAILALDAVYRKVKAELKAMVDK